MARRFYPKDLPHRRELEFASRVLNSIEINGSFYSLQQPTSYRRLDWWSARLKLWRQGKLPRDAKIVTAKTKPALRDVFVYFNNDAKVHASSDAQALARKMK